MITNAGAKKYFLHSGMLFANRERHLVTTILGSCVSVCLWDPRLKIGGLNHYLLPHWNGEGLSSPKYGNIAIEKLLQLMLKLGSKKNMLKAKVFGGASTVMNSRGLLNVGERNIILARNILEDENIPILTSDVGGHFGRKIIFDTEKGSVMLKVIKPKNRVNQPAVQSK
jgi:chemotaxis protein CheD